MKRLMRVLCLGMTAWSMLAGLAAGEVKLVKGQTFYVPSYTSHMVGTHSLDVKPVIFLHNIDQNNPINIVRIDFYNTDGKLVEKYLQNPQKLNANSATRINVKERLAGEEGLGAHFIIQWQAEKKVVAPIVEVWLIGAVGSRGYSFTSQGRIIQEEAD